MASLTGSEEALASMLQRPGSILDPYRDTSCSQTQGLPIMGA